MIVRRSKFTRRQILNLFWSQVQRPANIKNECWIWQGADRGNGFGAFIDQKGHCHYAHRYAFYQARGREERLGTRVIQECGNKLCVNWRHMKESERVGATRKLTPTTVNRILRHYKTYLTLSNRLHKDMGVKLSRGAFVSAMVRKFDISKTTIYTLINEETEKLKQEGLTNATTE